MKTIVIANQKGGSEKSTLTVHLAAAAEQAGDGPALITDTDPQGSAGDWFNQRKRAGIDTPRYAPLRLARSLLGREINPTVYTPAEFEKKRAAKDHFLTEVLTKPNAPRVR
jgi:cellulose biosynthesis protein BcsQ